MRNKVNFHVIFKITKFTYLFTSNRINNHGVVKTFTVRYKCCYGFKRADDSTGCSKKIILAPLISTIEDVGAKEYVNLIQSTGVENIFKTENLTVFAPLDLALNKFSDQITELVSKFCTRHSKF